MASVWFLESGLLKTHRRRVMSKGVFVTFKVNIDYEEDKHAEKLHPGSYYRFHTYHH